MYGCWNCGYLDKTRKELSENGTGCFRYGCNKRTKDKFICGWCKSDADLKSSYLGCSDWKEEVQESKLYKGLAKNFEVIVVAIVNGNNMTYQYSVEKFLKEFYHNDFQHTEHDSDIVNTFYYKGNWVTNFRIFKTDKVEKETIYDVVGYLMSKKYLEDNHIGVNIIPKIIISNKDQLQGQMSILDFIT